MRKGCISVFGTQASRKTRRTSNVRRLVGNEHHGIPGARGRVAVRQRRVAPHPLVFLRLPHRQALLRVLLHHARDQVRRRRRQLVHVAQLDAVITVLGPSPED